MKYYNALHTKKAREEGPKLEDSFLEVPEHLIPEEFYIIDFGFGDKSPVGKHGSLTTISSTWNAMAGTGIVSMPYAY